MTRRSRRAASFAAIAMVGAAFALGGCAQEPSASGTAAPATGDAVASSEAALENVETSAAATSAPATSAAATAAATEASDECSKENLTLVNPGTLTIGTDSPAYPPYFVDDDPTNGQGFESAVAYGVAKNLGFEPNEVQWVTVPFNSSYAPGDKTFDFDINQISITPKRQKAVDFSDGYYSVNQAVVALKDSPLAGATTLQELQAAKLGAQIGTTSLDYITAEVQPAERPYVYNDTNDAKSALQNGQIDAIVVDLPTAFYITAVEMPKAKIIGQLPASADAEQFGLLFAKGNPLVTCANAALAQLKDSGELQGIQDEWLTGAAAPFFQ